MPSFEPWRFARPDLGAAAGGCVYPWILRASSQRTLGSTKSPARIYNITFHDMRPSPQREFSNALSITINACLYKCCPWDVGTGTREAEGQVRVQAKVAWLLRGQVSQLKEPPKRTVPDLPAEPFKDSPGDSEASAVALYQQPS